MALTTTILIDKKVRDQLKEFGKKGDTYNDIIKKLMEKCKSQK